MESEIAVGKRVKSAIPGAPRRKRTKPSDLGLSAQFLTQAAPQVRDHLAGTQDLKGFLGGAGGLTLAERRLLVEQATILFEQNYAHLPLKVAMHAVNPVQRLRLLRARLERQTPVSMGPEWRFHTEMSEIFHSVRDLHTNYLLPAPFNGKIAFLPFLVEEYQAADGPHFVVAHLMEGFSATGFGRGAELTHWAGMPIARAVDVNANRFAGSNAAARRSRGVESLTVRSLRIHLPPDEEFVIVGYVGTDKVARELRQDWLVADNLPPLANADAVTTSAASQGIDIGADDVARARRLLFAPETLDPIAAAGVQKNGAAEGTHNADIATAMTGVFRARAVTTPSGVFGHLRIFTFSVDDPAAFVNEFVRLVEQLPQNGLIIDVRGNGGGHIHASECALQILTPHHIVPEPVQFINTALNLRLCRKRNGDPQIDLGPWLPSLEQAVEIGSTFSAAVPITPEPLANAIGQKYHGPVVLITDARCYSATDIFAAGFQDHHIGQIIGVDDNTGAGGANVWTQQLLKQLLEGPTPDSTSPYKALPKQAGMRVSIRRTLRVGSQSGTPVEDLGVIPDVRHPLTKQDVLAGNIDLLAHAGQVLAAMPTRMLQVSAQRGAGGDITVAIGSTNIDRADIFVDGRPRASINLAGANASHTLAGLPEAVSVRVDGYLAGDLVAARTVDVR